MEDIELTIDPGRSIARKRTGLYSLDLAVSSQNGFGMPLNVLTELYGVQHVGKSSLAYFLMASLANGHKAIVCDLEGFDPDYLKSSFSNAGFKGRIHVIANVKDGNIRLHQEMIGELADAVKKDMETRAVLLDSVGAYISGAESAGDIGESFIGRRAMAMAQFARRVVSGMQIRKEPVNVILNNHTHTIIGGQGHNTVGGDTIKYMSAIRIMLWPKKSRLSAKQELIALDVSGKIEKNRFGGKGKAFQFCILPNYGVSPEMSMILDCATFGLCEMESTVKIGGKSLGYVSKLVEYARSGNKDKFNPFKEELEKYHEERFFGGHSMDETTNSED